MPPDYKGQCALGSTLITLLSSMSELPEFVRLQISMCTAEIASLEAANCYLKKNGPLARKWCAEFESRAKEFVAMSEELEREQAGCGVSSDDDFFAFQCFYYVGAAALNRAFDRTTASITAGDREGATRWLRIFRSLLQSYEAIAECTASTPESAKKV